VANGIEPLSGEGVPFALTSYRLLDELDVPSWERMIVDNVPWELPADRQPRWRREEMPLGDAIIEFR
jgi:hypothetical protein